MDIKQMIKKVIEEKDHDQKMHKLMDFCECGSRHTVCINSFGGNDFCDAWYEMRCEDCGDAWTVYDR